MPEQKEWVDITTFPSKDSNDYEKVLNAYLQPFWHTREVYDETVLIVGKEGSATLAYEPKGSIMVRNYNIDTVYTEGVDFSVSGKSITRIASGNLPYFEIDDYYLTAPNNPDIVIGVNSETSKIKFNENRYLYFSEGVGITNKQIAITYKTNDKWKGHKPTAKTKNLQNFVNKVKDDRSATILFYGDSITVGCNASGTVYGEFKNPFLPNWATLACSWIEQKYSAIVTPINKAVGGWSVANGYDNFDNVMKEIDKPVDLLVLAFGMNDYNIATSAFKTQTEEMAKKFLSANPNGSVVLVSTMHPNTESTWVGSQSYYEKVLLELEEQYANIAVSPTTTVFKELEEEHGKITRDWLANNVNHPNDFGVRLYAQTLLQTIFGDEFCKY